MLSEEYGLPLTIRSPLVAPLSMFSAFLVCGSVPLLAYFLKLDFAFELSLGMTAGAFRRHRIGQEPLVDHPVVAIGLETLLIGSAAGGWRTRSARSSRNRLTTATHFYVARSCKNRAMMPHPPPGDRP